MSVKTYSLQAKRKSSKRAPLKTVNADPFDRLSRNVLPSQKNTVVYGKYNFSSSSSSSCNCSSGSDVLFKSLRLTEEVPFLRTSILSYNNNNNNNGTKKKKRKEKPKLPPASPEPAVDSSPPKGSIDWSEIEAFELVLEKKRTACPIGRVLSRPRSSARYAPEPSHTSVTIPSSDRAPKYSTPKTDEIVSNREFLFLENSTPISSIDDSPFAIGSPESRHLDSTDRRVVGGDFASGIILNSLEGSHHKSPIEGDIATLTKPTPLKLKPCRVVVSPLQLVGKSFCRSSNKSDIAIHDKSSLTNTYCRRKRSTMFGRKVLEETGTIPKQQVLDLCQQVQPLTFQSLLPKKALSTVEKIGEGTYAEVFRSGSRVLKIVPVEGDFKVNSEIQKTFRDVLSEMIVSRELSGLANDDSFMSTNYIRLDRVFCVRGRYPKKLLQEWRRFARCKESLNDCPDIFPSSQLFVIFEFADGGIDLESYQFVSAAQGKSVIVQIACALAVAENALEFEHRDLHWSNVLVRPTSLRSLDYVLGGRPFSLPSEGVLVSIIDFTLSRLSKDGRAIYTDLSEDPSFFAGSGDYQYDIYRKMRRQNGNDWRHYEPRSNVFWLHYLLRKMCEEKKYPERQPHPALVQMRKWSQSVLKYTSSTQFVQNIFPNTF